MTLFSSLRAVLEQNCQRRKLCQQPSLFGEGPLNNHFVWCTSRRRWPIGGSGVAAEHLKYVYNFI